jgi:3-methyladenine DNA glycosylase AlkC
MARMRAGGQILLSRLGPEAPERLLDHPSDTVRSWACFALGFQAGLSLETLLKRITPLADDRHWGVRETAWMAARPAVSDDLEKAIRLLGRWSQSDRENLRRFGSEISRPRGVWCTHIERLKSDPGLALSILEPLHADHSRYVQNSVANWINDASKTRPDWAREVCAKWTKKSDAPATKYIVKRGLRTLEKPVKAGKKSAGK